MRGRGVQSVLAGVLAGAAPAWAQVETQILLDGVDAALRRSDGGNNGQILPASVLPDVVRVTLCPWLSLDPVANPYNGLCVPALGANLVKIDIVFQGLVNPPGTIGIGGNPFTPYQYGPSPVYGFLEFDIDSNIDSGGELNAQATSRYLGNIARFGRRPSGPIGARAAVSRADFSNGTTVPPHFERSGADWVFTFCGCWAATIEKHVSGNGNGFFEPGESWIVRGRFFQRAGGYSCSSTVVGPGGIGQYDPWLTVRFAHSTLVNQTTVSLVYPLNMVGAAQLAGQVEPPPINFSASDATSIVEGLNDLVVNAPFAGSSQFFCGAIYQPWIGQNPADPVFLDPTTWDVRGIFATSYGVQEPDAFFAFTDTVFGDLQGDVNGDLQRGSADRAAIQQRIALLDGTPEDCDGSVNGSVTLCNHAFSFDMHDVTNDGTIGALDISFICPADFNGDGLLTPADFAAFQTAWLLGDPRADFNNDTFFTVADFGAFQSAFGLGCL